MSRLQFTSAMLLSTAVLAVAAPASHAANHALGFSAATPRLSSFDLDDGSGRHVDNHSFDLGPVDPALLVQAGDTLRVTVTFDETYRLPMQPSLMYSSIWLALTPKPEQEGFGETATAGRVIITVGGVESTYTAGNTRSVYGVFSALSLVRPSDMSLDVDRLVFDFEITSMERGAGGLIEHGYLTLANISAVPEPAAAALWLAGLGMLGIARPRLNR